MVLTVWTDDGSGVDSWAKPLALQPGEGRVFELDTAAIGATLWATVDEDGDGAGVVIECQENNRLELAVRCPSLRTTRPAPLLGTHRAGLGAGVYGLSAPL